MNIYTIPVKTIDGEVTTLDKYRNKILLIVNVASRCGFTKQYADLEALYQQYQAQGLVILGFPCNQFANQEPGDEQEIKAFCQLNYHVSFPLFSKIDVNGAHTHPLYQLLKSKAKGVLGSESIKWNFTKFLIDRSGNIVKRFAPKTAIATLTTDIEALL